MVLCFYVGGFPLDQVMSSLLSLYVVLVTKYETVVTSEGHCSRRPQSEKLSLIVKVGKHDERRIYGQRKKKKLARSVGECANHGQDDYPTRVMSC